MSISERAPGSSPGASPTQALAEALAAVRGLGEVLWSARSDGELVDTVTLLHRVSAALAAVEAGALAEADARDLAKTRLTGPPATSAWIRHRPRLE
jgi:hypothetical protein